MMPERDLQALHTRIVSALTWATQKGGFARVQLRDLAQLRVFLDWILENENKAAREYAAGIFRQLGAVDDLRKHYERSEGVRYR